MFVKGIQASVGEVHLAPAAETTPRGWPPPLPRSTAGSAPLEREELSFYFCFFSYQNPETNEKKKISLFNLGGELERGLELEAVLWLLPIRPWMLY